MASTVQIGGGSEKVTIDGVKVRDKMALQSFTIDYLDYANIPVAVRRCSACVLNNELYVIGNSTLYKWDGTTWTQVGDALPYWDIGNALIALNGEIHVFGLLEQNNYKCHYKWDGTTWTRVSTLPYIFNYASVVVLNDEIHILGGRSPYGTATEKWFRNWYKWDGTTWTQVGTLPGYRWESAAVVLNGEIHILGGNYTSYSTDTSYDTTNAHYAWNGNSWVSKASIPLYVKDHSAVVLNGEIHILGGNVDEHTTAAHIYNKHYKYITNAFYTMNDLPHNAAWNSSVVLNGKIHILTDERKHFVISPTVYATV